MAAIVVSKADIAKALLMPRHCQTAPNNTAPGKIMIPLNNEQHYTDEPADGNDLQTTKSV